MKLGVFNNKKTTHSVEKPVVKRVASKHAYYIDPVVLNKEMVLLVNSYREEFKNLLKKRKNEQQFKECISELITYYTIKTPSTEDIENLLYIPPIEDDEDAIVEVDAEGSEVTEKKEKVYSKKISEVFITSINKLLKDIKCNEDVTENVIKRLSKIVALENLTIKCGREARGHISEELGEMFMLIAKGVGNKKNFINYTYKEEMMGLGLEFLVKYAKKFNYDLPKANAFAYCSQICTNGFVQCLNKEKKQSKMKDRMIKQSLEHSESDKWSRNNDCRFTGEHE